MDQGCGYRRFKKKIDIGDMIFISVSISIETKKIVIESVVGKKKSLSCLIDTFGIHFANSDYHIVDKFHNLVC